MFHITGAVDQNDPLVEQLKAYSGHPTIEAAKEALRGAVRYGAFGGSFAYSIIGNDHTITVTVGTDATLVQEMDNKVMGSAPEPAVIDEDDPTADTDPEEASKTDENPTADTDPEEAPKTVSEEVAAPDGEHEPAL